MKFNHFNLNILTMNIIKIVVYNFHIIISFSNQQNQKFEYLNKVYIDYK